MELTKIESLLIKYEEGETSLQEEKFLKEYFTSEETPDHLKEYRALFNFSVKEKEIIYPKEVKIKSGKKSYAFIGIAASIILAIGVFTFQYDEQSSLSESELGTIENPEEAFLKTKEALQMVAEVLNNGQEELQYVEEFNNTTSKYIK